MPRVPKYCHHKASGLAYVFINGKRTYLGKHNSPESIRSYQRMIRQLAEELAETPMPTSGSATVAEVLLAYREHVDAHYVKNGEPTSEVGNIRRVCRYLRESFGNLPADEIRCSHLKVIRQKMIDADRCRDSINRDMSRARQVFKWASENEWTSPTVYHALQALSPLRFGRTSARESEPILPVSADDIEATLKHLPAVVADMVQLQLLTGARPGEIRTLKPTEVDRSADVWVYLPTVHKLQHHGRERVLFIGPKGQAILTPYLLRSPDAYCFQPAESEKKRHAAARANRKSKLTPSQRERDQRNDTTSNAAECYAKDAYCRAITRACKRAKVSPWAPNQLRHTKATELRKLFGVDAASTILGHSNLETTQVYAEMNREKAMEIMRKIG